MFSLVTIESKPWVAADDLAAALEYARTKNLIDLYRSNQDEFTDSDVIETFGATLAKTPQGGRPAKTTYFSEDGAVLLCMFARTPVAKKVRKQIRDVFVAWRQGKLTPPQLTDDTVEAQLDYNTNTVTLKLPFEALGRLTDVITDPAPKPKPQPAGWLFPETHVDEPPDRPLLRYDFADACQGMHGWYLSDEVAEVVGCTKNTVHIRNRLNRLPQGWTGKYKQGKIWIHIP